jgi:hypothetical protein
MCPHPDLIDAMVKDGASPATIAAFWRDAWNKAQSDRMDVPVEPRPSRWDQPLRPRVAEIRPGAFTDASPPAAVQPSGRRGMSSTDKSRRRRAALRELGLPNSYRGSIEQARADAGKRAGNRKPVAGNDDEVAGTLAARDSESLSSYKSLIHKGERE